MIHYENTVIDQNQKPVKGLSVTVTEATIPPGKGPVIDIFREVSPWLVKETNPFPAKNDGSFSFYAEPGRYDISFEGEGMAKSGISGVDLT